jgi:hypothetical protein
MRTIAIALVLSALCDTATLAQAQNACQKECREDQKACLGAHSKDSCKTNYDICMKHCLR